ncbi:MAG: hypothetical protein GX344_10020, partial [Intrasporangiaceae bacterium]|nr:hypothetical protein [Intrasporangiaceae bacterium]
TNPSWFYQALSIVFAGLLIALVGLALIVRRAPAADPATADRKTTAASSSDPKPAEAQRIPPTTTDTQATEPETTS